MSGASPASFLSPGIGGAGTNAAIGGGASGASSGGRVTFADDTTGILGGAGLRRRRGGVGEKENAGANNMSSMSNMPSGGIRKASPLPPRASLLSLSPMMVGGGVGVGAMEGDSTKSTDDGKVSYCAAEHSTMWDEMWHFDSGFLGSYLTIWSLCIHPNIVHT